MVGWVRIERDLFAHPFFAREPMSEREVWVWMVTEAAWQDVQHRVGQDMIDVPRGAFLSTLRDMQLVWGWGSDTRVRSFLNRLERERMVRCEIVVRKNARKTQISICNYDEYQSTERTENADKNARKTQGITHKRTIEQENKEEEKDSEAYASAENGAEVVDFAKQVFDRAILFLDRHGVKESQARAFVGKLRKNHSDTAIFDAFAACSKAGAVDPIPWIVARMTPPVKIRAQLPHEATL